jgi:hypothetical protein
MRVTLLCLAVLLIVPHVDAAPAPVPGRAAKEKLEALKKKLPDVVSPWAKERWPAFRTVKVRIVRMLSPTQAKVVVTSRWVDEQGTHLPQRDEVFTIFLDFYDGAWSATRCDTSWSVKDDGPSYHSFNKAIRFLMLAIDEAAEKP